MPLGYFPEAAGGGRASSAQSSSSGRTTAAPTRYSGRGECSAQPSTYRHTAHMEHTVHAVRMMRTNQDIIVLFTHSSQFK